VYHWTPNILNEISLGSQIWPLGLWALHNYLLVWPFYRRVHLQGMEPPSSLDSDQRQKWLQDADFLEQLMDNTQVD
jgi:hypothetical protein